MITLNDISILIVSTANDIHRLISVYSHIRLQYPTVEIVIVYDNINKKVLDVDDCNLIQVPTSKRVYVSMGYNLAVTHSTKKYFVFLHDDTYTAPEFLENLIPHLNPQIFCNFITIEPPVFGDLDSIYKPIVNLGLSSKEFQKEKLDSFYFQHIQKLPHIIEKSIYGGFFMAGFKESFQSINGFDENFQPYFFEDSDLMTRLHLANFKFLFVLNSIVYHIGSLTSRRTSEGVLAHNITHQLFIKKWKTTFQHIKEYSMLNNLMYKKINYSIEKINCNTELSDFLDLLHENDGDIILQIDGNKINQQDIEYLFQIPYIIDNINNHGTYQLGNLKFII
jgi:GT2 family glycosyltransferase